MFTYNHLNIATYINISPLPPRTVEIATLTRENNETKLKVLTDTELNVVIARYDAAQAKLDLEKKKKEQQSATTSS